MVKRERVNQDKAAVVAEYRELLRGAKSVYLADYAGLDVRSLEELRAQCRKESIQFAVVKNRLLRIAAAELGYTELGQHLEGPTAIAASDRDEVTPAKILTKFAKTKKKPQLKGAVVDGSVYGPADAQAFAALPSLEETRSTLLSVFQAPASKLVRMLATPSTQLARVLDARKDKLS